MNLIRILILAIVRKPYQVLKMWLLRQLTLILNHNMFCIVNYRFLSYENLNRYNLWSISMRIIHYNIKYLCNGCRNNSSGGELFSMNIGWLKLWNNWNLFWTISKKKNWITIPHTHFCITLYGELGDDLCSYNLMILFLIEFSKHYAIGYRSLSEISTEQKNLVRCS